MKQLMMTVLFTSVFMLAGCATTGASNEQEAAVPDSFTTGTPQQEFIYRSPPPAVVRAYGLGG